MIDQSCWNASVPVKIILEEYEPLLLMIPRISYLHLYLSIIRKHFANEGFSANISDTEVWFRSHSDNKPLQWHYPVGLLWDMSIKGTRHGIPWVLEFHYTSYSQELLPQISFDFMQQTYMHTMKQADYIWNGTSTYLMALTKQEQQQLWDSIWTRNKARYTLIMSKIFPENNIPKNIPFRIYILDNSMTMLQDLISPIVSTDSGESKERLTTVSDLLCKLKIDYEIFHIYLHGILIPLDTPLLWLSINMPYLDHFLHFVIIQKIDK